MPVPEEVMVQHIVKVYPGDIVPGVHCTSIWTQEQATTTDVIERVLEKLTILGEPNRFDLVEMYNEAGKFPETVESRGRSRTLQEFESPVKVQREWQFKRGIDGCVGEYRIYLRQKVDDLAADKLPDVKVTWIDGLSSPSSPDGWKFDPDYREEEEIDDLVDLPVLNENILLENLQKRFKRGRIYTYVGGILIAINPFKYFPIYNPKYVLSYQHRNLGELPPHIFAIADIAYHRMLKDRKNQCIVISGESGSGKTESTKLVLHHLTALSHKTQASVLERTILAAGPVLEAFGNAKTCHNNNSSRFGKFTEITYRADGVVCGAVLRKYLLEKSRIVAQADSERNYHVFYYLLVGANASERQALHLQKPEDYAYLNKSQCYTIDRVDESYDFLKLQDSMRSIGFSGEVQQRLFTVLSAVLQIGNVEFVPKERSEDAVTLKDNGVVDIISSLLKVDKQTLIDMFTVRKTVTRGEVLIRPYKEAEAIATRDGMAKALYGSVFDWIVFQINQTLKSRHDPRMSDVKAYSIGVLDIFGFEDFETNSFEQFCINFANENLQFYLNQHIFQIRQDEYLSEGLTWDKVAFVDNSSCLDLICGRPVGLINLLDEECSLSIGTDESLLAKFNKHHSTKSHYEKPPTKEPAFRIVHYAGVVKYNIKDFKAKNQDLMRNDIVSSLKNSKMLFVRKLLGSDPMAVYRWSILRHVICALSLFRKAGEARRDGKHFLRQHNNWTVTKSPTERKTIKIPLDKGTSKQQREVYRKATKVLNRAEAAVLRREHQRKKYQQIRNGMERRSTYDTLETYATSTRTRSMRCPTVIGQFQNSLSELMDTLTKSHPFFVRCLRSNRDKAPMEFNEEVVLRQLRYTGMLETVTIRQAGYPCRIPISDFVRQYRNLLPKGDLTSNDEVPLCLQSLGLDPNHYQVGKNKVFMRESQYKILREKLQSKLDNAAKTIQRWVRAKLERKKFLQIRKAAITIQAKWRSYVVSKKLLALQKRLAVKRIEDAWLVYLGTRKMRSVRLIQSNWRGYVARRRYKSLEKERSKQKEEMSQSDSSFDSTWHAGKAACLSCTCPLLTRRRKKFKVIVDVVRRSSFSSKYVLRSSSFRSDSFRAGSEKSKLRLKTVDIMRSSSLRSQAEINLRRRMDVVRKDSFRLWNEVAKKRKLFKKKKAEEKAQEKKEEESKNVTKEERDEMKNRAGSLPFIETRVDIGIPEPAALKSKALSTGNLGFAQNSHLYERLVDVQRELNINNEDGFVSERASGIYDEIEEFPTKERTMSTESNESNSSTGKKRSRERAQKEAVKSNVERRRSFFREKHAVTPKTSLGPVTSVGFAIVTPRDSIPARPDYKDALPVNENKSSLLKMVRHLTNRNKTIKRAAPQKPKTQSPMSSGGKEWKPTKEFVVDGDADFKAFNDFLFKRIGDMDPTHKGEDTMAVVLFTKALNTFHSNILNIYAVSKKNNQTIQLRYEEMSASFANVLELEAEKSKEKLPKDLGMNLFGSIVDDFVKHNANSSKKEKTWRRAGGGKKQAKHHEEFTIHNGHKYYMTSFSIVTFCEYCNSYIWERGFVCQGCKFTCHKKCSSRCNTPCPGKSSDNGGPKSIFGAKLQEISTDENPIPKAIEDLMHEIENTGLYTEGIYRKPGLQTHVKSLKNAISPPDYTSVDFSQYRVHVIASALKLFFRQLADPLVPREFYDDFIRATELPSDTEIQTRLCEIIFRFPKPNQELITRLIYHLAQVAMLEESNKMSPNGLSIIWAPCIMRSSEDMDPMDALRQLPLQTRCLEILISRKAANIRRTLADIETLEQAKLTSESALNSFHETNSDSEENRRHFLKEQIDKMDSERERLTENLPNLERIDSRGDLRIDSDDGITSDDGMTDNDDPMSFSIEVSVTTTPLQDPPRGKRQKNTALRKRANELAPRDDTLSPDSSFEDLSAELGDVPL